MKRRWLYLLSLISFTLLGGELLLTQQPAARSQGPGHQTVLTTSNPSGQLTSIFTNGNFLDTTNPFFQNLGTNGRSCVTCHVPAEGWTITPAGVQARFNATKGMDPIFRTNDGSNSPLADCSTTEKRRQAYSLLLNKGLIRVGLPIPANAEFELVGCDDPHGYANDKELSLFRRPMPTTNLRFITAVMWDGRESFAPSTFPIRSDLGPADNMERLIANLKHQAQGATDGHALGNVVLTNQQLEQIVNFELNIASAQTTDKLAGNLLGDGAKGGPLNLHNENFYVTINDVLGADVFKLGVFDQNAMTLYKGWLNNANATRASIGRGAVLFNTKLINITGVGGLNDDLNAAVIPGTCTTCHDSPNVGNHSVALPIDIGLSDASRRTSDLPLYTLRNKLTQEERQTTDPGRALITGKWKDLNKMKGPVLRALAARAPYFHNGSAATLGDAVDFYNTRFNIGFTAQEKADLVAFLKTL